MGVREDESVYGVVFAGALKCGERCSFYMGNFAGPLGVGEFRGQVELVICGKFPENGDFQFSGNGVSRHEYAGGGYFYVGVGMPGGCRHAAESGKEEYCKDAESEFLVFHRGHILRLNTSSLSFGRLYIF